MGRPHRWVSLDRTDPGNLRKSALLPQLSVLHERGGGGGVARGSQVLLLFLKVKLKIFARVA